MQKIALLGLSIVLLSFTSALAADKVVVIPLMRSGDPWIRVYDSNDQFVGYTHSFPNIMVPSFDTLISNKNYSAFTIPTPYGYDFLSVSQQIYLTPGCSGSSYISSLSFLPTIGLGMVFDLEVSDSDSSTWYLQYGTSATIPSYGTYYTKSWDTPCSTPATNGATEIPLFETHPNDSSITGFRDSSFYQGPFNYQYNLPPTTP